MSVRLNVTRPAATVEGSMGNLGDSLAAAAAEYAAAGLAVFPVIGKRPLIAGGFKSASADSEQVRSWWKRWPRASIGFPTGKRLVVIDVDPRNGGEVDPAWPATRTASTPSGGWHLFYRCPAEVRCGKAAQGIDVKGDGGYVVVPPSPGRRWLDEREPARVAASFFETDALDGEARRKPPFRTRSHVGEGERNDYMASAAGFLYWRGLDAEEVEDALIAHNANVCVPPLDEAEVRSVAASIGRRHGWG